MTPIDPQDYIKRTQTAQEIQNLAELEMHSPELYKALALVQDLVESFPAYLQTSVQYLIDSTINPTPEDRQADSIESIENWVKRSEGDDLAEPVYHLASRWRLRDKLGIYGGHDDVQFAPEKARAVQDLVEMDQATRSQVDGHVMTPEELESRRKADEAAVPGMAINGVHYNKQDAPFSMHPDLDLNGDGDPDIAYTPEAPFGEPTNYQEKAQEVVRGWLRNRDIAPNVYVVWFVKVLGHHKALVSTDELTGFYFEVTYNGNKDEYYLDVYVKQENIVVPAEHVGAVGY
jgi:hypothetical protein